VVHRLGAAALLLLGYTLDANGHRTAEVWERPGERVETRYGLDLAERLTSIEVDGRRVVYTLDAVGNRTAEASPEGERIHSYDARDRLVETRFGGVVEASYGYDAAGRQLSVQRGAQSRTYVYDAEDRLLAVSASGAAPIRYAVDGFGQRRERESGGQVERYQWDGTRLASISNALGNRLADYQHAYGWPISVREGSERRSALADVHGTIQLLTDDTGVVRDGVVRDGVVRDGWSGTPTGSFPVGALAADPGCHPRTARAGSGQHPSLPAGWTAPRSHPSSGSDPVLTRSHCRTAVRWPCARSACS
jgi:YD repeat-containing protein